MKTVIFKSDYSNNNTLQITQRDDGDVVIRTTIRDENDRGVTIATTQGGSRLKHNGEIIKHFSAIIELLSGSEQNENIVRVVSD